MIYLDHNATAPVRPEVRAAMLPWLDGQWGSPSSIHAPGRRARQAVEDARRTLAALLRVHHGRVVFTSGGTEANCAILLGTLAGCGFAGEVIVSAIEHPSILEPCRLLARRGVTVRLAPVSGDGRVDVDWIAANLTAETRLVSVMHANNETGVLQPIATIGAACRARGVPFHVDATQSVGRIEVDLEELPIDFLTLSGHKFGGPKGVGALIIDRQRPLQPLLVGGGQEWGQRAGTENVAGIVGLAAAVTAVAPNLPVEAERLAGLRTVLERAIMAALPECVIFGREEVRLPNTTCLGLEGLDGATLVMNLDLAGFAVSSGAACSSGKVGFSHVLRAMGVAEPLGRGALRVSLGWSSRPEEIEQFTRRFVPVVERLRKMS
ncbi:MAG: cysteine desulfurase [Magnetococcales bacterium]|nr:cysteine desulfurase [Magnetococcales bacterium]